jgi:hypothetical protein
MLWKKNGKVVLLAQRCRCVVMGRARTRSSPPRQADSSGLGFTGGAILIASLIAHPAV